MRRSRGSLGFGLVGWRDLWTSNTVGGGFERREVMGLCRIEVGF